MHKLFLASAAVLCLAGCAETPTQFADGINGIVNNTNNIATNSIDVVTDVAKTVIAIYQPVTAILAALGVNL